MPSIVVSLKSNVEQDEDQNLIFDEDGAPTLIDEDDIGVLVKTHSIQVSQINPNTGLLETGIIFRAEVFWNLRRNPAPDMVDPGDLVWTSITTHDDEVDEEDADDTDGYDDTHEGERFIHQG